MKYLKSIDRKGFTLIELIVVLALIGLLITAIFSFFLFGNNTFRRSESMSRAQADVRIASDFISTQVRNASIVTFSTPTDLTGYNQLILKDNQLIFISSEDALLEIPKTDKIIVNQLQSPAIDLFEIVLQIDDPNVPNDPNREYFLNFNVIGEVEGEIFTTQSSVLLNNVTTPVVSSGNHLYFKMVEPKIFSEGSGGGEEVGEDDPVTVNNYSISGLTKPKQNQNPDTSMSTPSQYSLVSITWYDASTGNVFPIANKFVNGKQYYAVIRLQANSGYTFIGVTANSFLLSSEIFIVSNPVGVSDEMVITTIPYTA